MDELAHSQNHKDHSKTTYLQSAHHDTLYDVLDTDNDMVLLMQTIYERDYLKGFHVTKATCHEFSHEEVFNWNFHLWVTGFLFLGLQFTHLDIGPMQAYVLTWASMKTWGPGYWSVFALQMTVFATTLYLNGEHLLACHVLLRYLVWAALLIGFFVWNSRRLAPGRAFHVHHYCQAGVMLSLLGY